MYIQLNDIHLIETPHDAHAFYLLRYSADFIFDGLLTDSWRKAGFTGVRFTPLQPPTEIDALEKIYFQNNPYWPNQGY